MTEHARDLAPQHFPSIESQTVDGKLVVLPIFTDAPALYYRDLLEHGKPGSGQLGRNDRDRAPDPGGRTRRRQPICGALSGRAMPMKG